MIDPRSISSLEKGESGLTSHVRTWIEHAGKGDVQTFYRRLRGAVLARLWERRGFPAVEFGEEPLRNLVSAPELDRFWDEAHALGWFHQHFGEQARSRSFAAHTGDEEKHADAVVSTQLYTPRWVADLLAEIALEEAGAEGLVLDPACGGGQMLLAAFDTLMRRGVPAERSILRLYGVDLDPRAVEVCRETLKLELARSLGRRDPGLESEIDARILSGDSLFEAPFGSAVDRFDVVLTNPPYMGSRSMPEELKLRIREKYRPFHGDLYTAFIARCYELGDVVGILAQQTVWFLSRFEKARRQILATGELVAFLHLGPHVFGALSGEKANVVAFVQRVARDRREKSERPTVFVDVRAETSPARKRVRVLDVLESGEARSIPVSEFEIIPGSPLAYWLPGPLRRQFAGSTRLGELADIPGSQNKTGRNREFVRSFRDVPADQIRSADRLWERPPGGSGTPRWVFYSKGGKFAPWWGNWQWVVDWSPEARRFYAENKTSNLLDEAYWFRRGICYTDFAGSRFNARLMPAGCVFDMAGPAIFPHEVDGVAEDDVLFAMLALLNSTACRELLNALNPSIHYQVRDVRNLPVPQWNAAVIEELAHHGRRLVEDVRVLCASTDGPESFGVRRVDPERLRSIAGGFAEREYEADRVVCALYGDADLALPADERPLHHAVDSL